MARKRLEDLYVRGKEVTIEDGGESLTVWVQKLNRVDTRNAVRRADAARARVLALRSEPDSDELWAIKGEVIDVDDRDYLIRQITAEEERKIRVTAEAKTAARDEWSEHGYLEGLRDSWDEGLRDAYATDPEDPEARRVFNELKKFAEAAQAEADTEIALLRGAYENMPIDELRDEAVDVAVKAASEEAWLEEFRACEVWLSVRDAHNHKQRYYTARHEIDALEDETWVQLIRVIDAMRVDPMEGKGLEETPTSSAPSEPPAVQATEVSSGLVGAGA